MCKGGESKRITVMTRPGDVIAGGSGCMGPCPPPQHQPPGIYLSYTRHTPGICPKNVIYQVYAGYILIEKSIYQVYTQYIPCINLLYDDMQYIPDIHPLKTFWDISVPVTLRYGHGIYQVYTLFILGICYVHTVT